MQLIPIADKKPIFSWCPDLEPQALKQMEVIAGLPFVEHCAVMPDGHLGNDCCVGGVVACSNVVVPNFVGLDISCGMGAFRTNLRLDDFTDEKKNTIHSAVERAIPTGFSHNTDSRRKDMAIRFSGNIKYLFDKYATETKLATTEDVLSQVGTLGGGNHMLEVQYDEEGFIWGLVHSGSRNIGKQVCEHFNELAEKLMGQWHANSSIPFLPLNVPEGKEYLSWMNFCVNFSFLNRSAMLEDLIANITRYFPTLQVTTKEIDGVEGDVINISHNYASLENFGEGKNWMVHRKGAVLARKGTIGIIPGSQSTNSFITVGLGNEKSLNSCSHGAGRRMGRKEFNVQNQGRLHEIEGEMKTKGIVFSKFKKSERGRDEGMYDLSEAGGAYKDISSVMSHQADLVKPIVKLTPIINWKG